MEPNSGTIFVTNWYWLVLESNWIQRTTDIIKLIKDAAKAIYLILFLDKIRVSELLEFSLIGNNNKDPIKGIINNNVSI